MTEERRKLVEKRNTDREEWHHLESLARQKGDEFCFDCEDLRAYDAEHPEEVEG